MEKVIQKTGENRKDYLLRVVATFLKSGDETIIYDDAECDEGSIIEDICLELNISEEDL